MIEPQLRQLADAAARHEQLPIAATRGHTTNENGREWVDLWLEGIDPAAVEAVGGHVGTTVGGLSTAHVPAEALSRLLDNPALQRAQMAQSLTFQSDVSVPLVGATSLWGGTPPNYPTTGKTGKRVVIGIVDSGLDFKHADFLKGTTSQTRLKWYWDQTGTGSPRPTAGYGTEYAGTAIDSGKCSSSDYSGHGTSMAGIAAGNGRGTGNGKAAYKYVGAAPEADLVVVQLAYYVDGSVPDSRVVDGISYVFQKAAALGEPAVVVVAASKWTGPHDGHDPLDRSVAALTGPGKIVVAAAGNYGSLGRHGEWTSTGSNQTGDITMAFGAYVPSSTADDNLFVESWYDAGVSYTASVVAPTGEVVGPVARGGTLTQQTASGVVIINNGQATSDNGSYRVDVMVLRQSMTQPQIAIGTWKLRFGSQTTGTHRVDSWITGWNLGIALPAFVLNKTEARTVGAPATANNVIAVGAWNSRPTWTAINGGTYSFPGAVLNDLAGFSAVGPRRDGVMVPHIAAPGCGVAGSRKKTYYPSTSYYMPDSAHVMTSGTSSAAALTGGCVAIVLQDNPTYTPAQVLTYLQNNSVKDSYTGTGTSIPNGRWGWGKLHLAGSAPTAVSPLPMLESGLKLASRNPGPGPFRFSYTLSAAELAESGGSLRFEVFDVRGRLVSSVQSKALGGRQTTEWGGRSADGSLAGPGVYWARLATAKRQSVARFVIRR